MDIVEIITFNKVYSALVAVLLCTVAFFWPRRDTKNLPPGPKPGLWGNKIPSHMWLYFDKLSKKYGPVFTVWLGSQPFIIVTNWEAAAALMERKSNHTSDRPKSVIAAEVLSGNLRTGITPYGDRWRRLRKALHSHLTLDAAKSYQPRQILASHQVLKDILADPDNYKHHVRSYAATVIMSLTYSKNEKSTYQDPEISRVVKCLNRFHEAAQPGKYLLDYFPLLRYWPTYLDEAKQGHREELELFKEQLEKVRGKMNSGETYEPCFASYIIEHQKQFKLNNDEAAYLAGSMFGAGSDTTVSALMVALLAAAAFPEKVKHVHEELDEVVGRDRTPIFDDWPALPQTWAFILESYRWRPVLPAGLAHAVTETFTYNNMVIPKGAIITGNHWSIHRDPNLFTNPEEFDPSRWLVKESDGTLSIRKDLRHVQFGFGRRICAGANVADRSVFINSASILWAFDLKPGKDEQGEPIPLDLRPEAFDDAVTSHPLPFKLDIQKRFEGVDKVISSLESFGQ